MERQTGGNPDASWRVAGKFQRRRRVGCHRKYQRRPQGNRLRAPGTVFRHGRGENLRKFHGTS